MKIRRDVLATSDIDFFCLVSGVPIHFASAGCIKIPDLVNNRAKLIQSQRIAFSLPDDFKNIFVNVNLIKRKIQEEEHLAEFYGIDDFEVDDDKRALRELTMEERIQMYASSFVYFASKGFFSFDRSEVTDPESSLYNLIAFPKTIFPINMNIQIPSTTNHFLENLTDSQKMESDILKFEKLDINYLLR